MSNVATLAEETRALTGMVEALVARTRGLAEFRRGSLSATKRQALVDVHDAVGEVVAALSELSFDPDAFAIEWERFERVRSGL